MGFTFWWITSTLPASGLGFRVSGFGVLTYGCQGTGFGVYVLVDYEHHARCACLRRLRLDCVIGFIIIGLTSWGPITPVIGLVNFVPISYQRMSQGKPRIAGPTRCGLWLRFISGRPKLSPSESRIFKTVSQELCPSDGKSHTAADGCRPCEGTRRCQAFSCTWEHRSIETALP